MTVDGSQRDGHASGPPDGPDETVDGVDDVLEGAGAPASSPAVDDAQHPDVDADPELAAQHEPTAQHELTAETRAITVVPASRSVDAVDVEIAEPDEAPEPDEAHGPDEARTPDQAHVPDEPLDPDADEPEPAPAATPSGRDAPTDVLPPVDLGPDPAHGSLDDEPVQMSEALPEPLVDDVPLGEQEDGDTARGPVFFADVDPEPATGPAPEAHDAPGPAVEAASEPADGPASAPGFAIPATPAAPAETNGWVVLGRALRPRLTRAQLLAAVLCAVLGFALVVQVRQTGGASLEGMRQADLVRILDETTTRGDALAREAADLQRERDGLVSGSDTRQAAIDAAERNAATQGILTGRLPAEGPGVTVTLTEPDGAIKPATMLNLLEELRNAGAEAIELNGQRITASSAFTGTAGAVEVDGVTLHAPYQWIAIGDPDIIGPALKIPGGALAQVRNNGGHGTVDAQDLVQVTAVRAVPDPVYATPVPPQTD